MKTRQTLIPIIILCSIFLSACNFFPKNTESISIEEISNTNNDTLLINNNMIYTGIIKNKDYNNKSALWIYPDSTFVLISKTSDLGNGTISYKGNLTISSNYQIKIPLEDTVLWYSYSETELIPINSDNSPIMQENIDFYKLSNRNGITDIVWEINEINNESIENYEASVNPYIIFTNDSTYIFGNCGCNEFIGECKIYKNSKIKIHRLHVKDNICPADALERDFLYMLSTADHYYITQNSLILYHKENPIGYFTANYIY